MSRWIYWDHFLMIQPRHICALSGLITEKYLIVKQRSLEFVLVPVFAFGDASS